MSDLRRWLFAGAGLGALAVILLGALVAGMPRLPAQTAAPASQTAPVTALPTATVPSPTPIQTTGAVAPYRVWFARDELPPVAGTVQAIGEQNAVDRTAQRVSALIRAGAQTPPAGATDPAALIRQRTIVSGGSIVAVPPVTVRIDGDTATAEFDIEDWGVRGSAITQGLLQQLVYTITEEAGITKARIIEKGKTTATIDQLVLDRPLSREDVFGYSFKGTDVASISSGPELDPGAVRISSWLATTGATEGPQGIFGRLSIEVVAFTPPIESRTAMPPPARPYPAFKAELLPVPTPCTAPCAGKWRIVVTLPTATGRPSQQPIYLDFIGGPTLAVDARDLAQTCPQTGPCTTPVAFSVYLDDARPWRVSMEPGESGVTRINVDVGGRPQWVNEHIAVYSVWPRTGGGVTVRGAARVFEANVSWRIKDVGGRIIARGNTNASVGTSPVWGTFELTAASTATGPTTLEVYWVSPRDGSDQDVIAIPLEAR